LIHQESVGDEFAGYRIEGVIRHGGMATVYQARHLVLQRPAALKVLAPALARDQRFRARFLGESRTAASLDHPHIVPIYDAGEAHGVLYIAMRLIEGADLRTILDSEGRLEPRRAVTLLAQVASALDAAHARGLVHRDVKPSNILVATPTGPDAAEQAYLADFGITKQLDAEGLTATSEFLGTIDYMSPEQIEGLSLDGRADVYALGCVLHQCLTGTAPFTADTVVGVMHAHLTRRPPRPSAADPSLPGGLDAVVGAALAKSPDERPSTCTALVDAARAALDSPRRRPAAPPFVPSLTPSPSPAPPTSPSVVARRPPVPGAPATAAATSGASAPRPSGASAAGPSGASTGGASAAGTSGAARRPAAAVRPPTVRVPEAPPPARQRPGGRTPGGVRRWQALLAGVTALLLAGVVAAATVRGIQGPSTGNPGQQATGLLPLPTPTPPPPTATIPPPTATPTGAPAPPPASSQGPVVVPVTPSSTAEPRPTAGPTHRPGPTDTARPTPSPTSTPAACEPSWPFTCEQPGTCHSVDMNQPVDVPVTTSGKPDGGWDSPPLSVASQGVLCAHWSTVGIRGELLDDQGNVVQNTDSPTGVGFIVRVAVSGRYHVRLWRVDASTPGRTTLQINT
jgi:serine/threonine protein kinase